MSNNHIRDIVVLLFSTQLRFSDMITLNYNHEWLSFPEIIKEMLISVAVKIVSRIPTQQYISSSLINIFTYMHIFAGRHCR